MEVILSIAKDFTKSPGTGLRKEMSSDGYSGEEFREQLLLPKLLERHDSLIIDFDGVAGYHPSFFDGSFIELANIIGASTCINLLLYKKLVFRTKEFKKDIEYIKTRWTEMEKEELTCLIDDFRNFRCDFIIRTGESAVKVIPNLKKKIDILYLDYNLDSDMTGLDVIQKLESLKYLPNIIKVVSTHPSGKVRLFSTLKMYNFIPLGEHTYFRRKK